MKEIFIMTEKGLSIYHMILRVEEGLKQMRASELLGISERHFRRLLKAYREKGAKALASKKIGKPSNNCIKKEVRKKVVKRLSERYQDCGPTFAMQKLAKEGIDLSKESIRKIMIEVGLWEPKKRKRLKLYQRRSRRSCEGELIQMDGSPHAWFEDRGPKCSLLGFIDDATSNIKHLKFVEVESTLNYFLSLKEYILKHGKPIAYYTDRLSVFRVNNGKEGYRKKGLTQVGRALKELGIELICANSPQAKGRIERLFGTLQDRLVKELRLREINTMEKGNRYLEEYISEHNRLFGIAPEREDNMHRPAEKEEVEQAFCFKEERLLSKNLELSYEGRILQIKTEEPGYSMRRAKATVKEDLQGKITIEYKGKELAYKELLVKDHQGRILNRKEVLAAAASPL